MHGSATAENLLLNVSNVTPTLQPTDEAARTRLFCWGKLITSENAERSGRLQSTRAAAGRRVVNALFIGRPRALHVIVFSPERRFDGWHRLATLSGGCVRSSCPGAPVP